jgi:ABC-type dipeptide/oligopeptide/nickel transport system permease component
MTINTITAVLVLIGNFVADILYAIADPRIRYG